MLFHSSPGRMSLSFLLLLSIPFILAFYMVAPFHQSDEQPVSNSNVQIVMQDKAPQQNNSLQLNTLVPVTIVQTPPQTSSPPTQPPTTTITSTIPPSNILPTNILPIKMLQGSPHDTGISTGGGGCGNGATLTITCDGAGGGTMTDPAGNDITSIYGDKTAVPAACAGKSADDQFCSSKPVIYLYPQKLTIVNVVLHLAGEVVESNPFYPQNGWQNILAFPNGNFLYNGKSYRELYFEALITLNQKPQSGIVVSKDTLETALFSFTHGLGLNTNEQKEFVDFWVPRLKKLEASYIFISVVDMNEKEKIDRLEISPKPDTLIQFLAYFKPLTAPISVKPLFLPDKPPQRKGFTVVEWGGGIDK